MKLYPAIDILGGNAVRLVKGDFDAKKVYDEDPLSAARGWTEAGARFLHVVDLDGAKTGEPVNLEHLRRIAGELGVPVQYGGGPALGRGGRRCAARGRRARDPRHGGVHRPRAAARGAGRPWPERVLVSVDVRGGEVAAAGWTKTADVKRRGGLCRA